MKRLFWTILALVLAPAAVLQAAAMEAYDYPFVNALESTVVGTPSIYAADVPKEIPVEDHSLTVFEDRELPDLFWYSEPLQFSLVPQKHKAPLIFMIAGTGASYKSPKMVGMQKAFYQAGFHVISISSPTHMNFIINASTTSVPGYMRQDARDLYRVMELAYQKVASQVAVSDFYLTGYSLGATQSAFVAKLDETRKSFNFKKVLMINPAVSLFNSVQRLDKLLADTIGSEPKSFNSYMGRVVRSFVTAYDRTEPLDFNEDFLYRIVQKRVPTDDKLESLIGFSFRISSSNMIFTADVMSRFGLVVPPERELGQTDSLNDYFGVLLRTSFMDYFYTFFYPFNKAQNPSLTAEQLMYELSLKRIEPYLRDSEKIELMTNDDDIILAPGEIDWLREVFGRRAKIWPTGGHCGNMEQKDVVAFMVDYFKR
ncbi:MAG: alpha/beta hydrolase [Desulfosarcina sp.]|nr:alpha/beta hydrolase [Desulfobacterales bacterium]